MERNGKISMKNKKLIKVFAAIISCLLLVGAVIGISVAAEETAPAIEYKNLAYEGAVQIVYYVKEADVKAAEDKGYTVKLATWTEADKSDLVEKEAESFTKVVGETEYTVFASKGIAPKMMRDTVYAQTVLCDKETGEVEVSGDIVEYSIYTYVKNRILKGSTADQKALYHALVDYGASVQKVLGYKTSVLANDMFMDYSKFGIVEPKTTTTYLNYNEATGTWAKGTADSHQYIVVHGSGFHTELGLDGNSFIYTKPIVIKSITGAGDTITWNDVDYKAGSTIPRDWLGFSWGYGDEEYASFNVQHKESTTGDILAVFDTNLTVTDNGITNATAGAGLHIFINATPNSYEGNDPTIANTGITLHATNFAIRKLTATNASVGADAVYRAYGSTINLRIVARAVEGDSTKATLTLYVDGEEINSVTSSAKNVTDYSNPTPGSLFFMTCASARNLEMTFTDTTFVNYIYFNEIPGTNAVRPVATDVSGTKTTEKTATLNGKTVGYEIRYTNAWDEATQSYILSKGVYITSIDGKTDDSESITLDSQTLKVGDAISKGQVADSTEPYTKITATAAGATVDGSIFQFKTDLVIDSTHVSGNANANALLLGINSADSNNFSIVNYGGNIIFHDGANRHDTGVAFGEKFELVIRGYETGTEGSYRMKYYANGILIFEKTVNAKPTAIQLKAYSTTVDMKLTFTNTYCDSYKIPDISNVVGTNAVRPVATDVSGTKTTEETATLDGKTVGYEIRYTNAWDEATQSYVFSKGAYITSIDGAESITVGGKTLKVGDALWRPHGYDSTEPYAKIAAVDAGASVDGMVFQFVTDLVIESSCVNADGGYTNNVLLGINSADQNNFMIINKGGNVLFGDNNTGVAFGEKFQLVIRGYETGTEGSYEMKYYVNGFLILTKTITVAPTAVQFKTYSQTADMSLTFTNTYCDKYTAAAE